VVIWQQFTFEMEINYEYARFYVFSEFKREKTAITAYNHLKAAWGEKAPGRSTIFQWFKEYKDGSRTSFLDLPRSGRPSLHFDKKTVDSVRDLLEPNRKISLREMSNILGFNKDAIHHIITNMLEYRKISSVWLPYPLTDKQKEKRVTCANAILKMFRKNSMEYLRRCFVVQDETWCFFKPINDKDDAKVWCHQSEKRPRIVKLIPNVAKSLLMICYTSDGKFYIEGTIKDETIDSTRYMEFVGNCIEYMRKYKGKSLHKNEIIWQHDNAKPHISVLTKQFFQTQNIDLIKQSTYSPDLNQCDRWLNKYLKREMKKMSYDTLDELLKNARKILKAVPHEVLEKELNNLIRHCKSVINCGGDYTMC
jgi:histone-lysine N-methyltransferase SETMAR